MKKPSSYPCPNHLIGHLKQQPIPEGIDQPPEGWVYVGDAEAKESAPAPGILFICGTLTNWIDENEQLYYAGAGNDNGGHFAAPSHWIS